MAQNQRTSSNRTSGGKGRRTDHTDRRGGRQDEYIYGNAVRRLDIQEEMEEAPRKKISHETRKNREKASHMSLGYMVFLVGALCLAGMILLNYVQLQAQITNTAKEIAGMESELNGLKLKNDEEYNRIVSSVNLEEIKRIAIGELGMTYAKEGQIVTYANEGNDYMRKVAEE